MITGVYHTSLTVTDLESSIRFYTEVMGMKFRWDSSQAGIEFKGPVADLVTGCPGTEQRVVYLNLGEDLLELIEYAPMGKPLASDHKASDIGICHICFSTDNIQELYKKLLEVGMKIHCEPQNIGFAWVMYFRDPDGNILEARQELKKRW
jgi:catechol 2,3-dioxygenase-like lactoylglutathione lyase family enzyme